MSDPVLSQLVSVEADLAQQAESLETQLSQIQARREGLQTVIDMFEGGESSAASNGASTQRSSAKAETEKPARKVGRPPGSKTRKAAAVEGETTPKKKPGRKPKAASAAPDSKKTATPSAEKKATGKKKDGRAADWQKYVQPEYKDSALPEAVSSVLRSAPSDVFKIADVMSSIFVEDMPRNQFLKARNRISNILSAGARDGTWYRGRNGRYSQSENATK